MKKSVYLIIAVLIFSAARFAFAQEMKGQMMGGGMQEKGMMMNQGMQDEGMMQMRGKMGQGMMQDEGMMQMHGMMGGKATMVSTEDGGVIVMIGKTLYKYDKDLNLIKQVELPIEGPMDKMTDKKGKMDQQQRQENATQNGGASNHESHH